MVGPQHDMPNQTSDFRLYTHSCRTCRMTKIRKEKVAAGGRGGIVDFMAAKPLPSPPMGPV